MSEGPAMLMVCIEAMGMSLKAHDDPDVMSKTDSAKANARFMLPASKKSRALRRLRDRQVQQKLTNSSNFIYAHL
jgi:hypothetical protein